MYHVNWKVAGWLLAIIVLAMGGIWFLVWKHMTPATHANSLAIDQEASLPATSPSSSVNATNSTGTATATSSPTHAASTTLPKPRQPIQSPVPVLANIKVSCQVFSSDGNFTETLPRIPCSASGNYKDGSSQDITAQVAWNLSGNAGGSIDQNGDYIPDSEGTETITATLDNINGSTQITIP